MDPRRDSQTSELRADLDAALQTRKELGAEYESALVDSFLSRVDSRLDARVEQRVAERLADLGPAERFRDGERRPDRERRRGWGGGNKLPFFSLALAIPLTGIGSASGLTGMLVTWAGIVGVNVAAALGNRWEQEREERRRVAARSEWA
ncbi:hypothetical protein OG455_24535 [Kitasatospora sp. NBC_01287]|uniref:hypothetical protein n=1 Tax=Kitasatospora sp. NBC_01287 TaxID=2903573 RepID=UPI00225013D8|nr:hypothetical protein [Kitasatospora sp. NBC_01287]MCX4748646.1 hypothetical protein [Kitasatospora sp. NBC_01287]